MLINFSVENFRSFREEQTLNLVASGKLQDHPEHGVPIGETGKKVLRAGVVYGANAAGKSNLVRAILLAQSLIQGTSPFKKLALSQFRFCRKQKPTSFEFRFLVNGQVFVYGFAITQKAIVEEWLDATSEKGREVSVFGRKDQQLSIGNLKAFGREGEASGKALKALKLLGVRPDQLLLNKIVDLTASHRGKLLDHVAWWFAECLTVIQADSSFGFLTEFLNQEADFRRFAGAFLQNVGTGISDLHIERSEIDAEKVPRELLEGLQAPKDQEATIVLGGPGVNLQLDPEDPTKVIRSNLAARHQVHDADYSLPFQDESDGTQRCLNLLPAIYHLTKSYKVFVIDEIDRSLHPLLCHALLKLFVESCPGACQQMIVTTHETHLLDLELLRRDEIWFVEKDDKQQTQLYSLADMNVRNDVRIEKGYLQGRFGGIPFIGDTKKLMDMIQCPANGKAHAKKRPLDRTTGTVRDANLIVIASEDKYAVRQYFEFFRSTKIQFKVLETDDGKSAPAHVLARLDEYMKEYDIGEGDEFWLACDCDHWIKSGHIKNLVSVIKQCRQKGINIALSNPCFDLWLLLHFADFPQEDKLTCAEVGKRIRNAVGGYDKTKVYHLPIDLEKVQSAVKRSADNQPASTEIPERPQTAIHLIIDHLINRGILLA